jgi:hypothetical protein
MKRLCLALLVLASGLALAQTNDCSSLSRQALEISGFNQEIDQGVALVSSDSFVDQLSANKSESEQFLSLYKPIMQKNFKAEDLKRELQQRLTARCQADQMMWVVDVMRTPLISRMFRLESEAAAPQSSDKLKKFAELLKVAPPTDERIASVHALIASTGALNLSVDSMAMVLRGLMTGMGISPELIAESQDQIEQQRAQLKSQMEAQMETVMLFTYRTVRRSDLENYARALSADPLRWFFEEAKKSFLEMMEEHSRAVGKDLKEALAPKINN